MDSINYTESVEGATVVTTTRGSLDAQRLDVAVNVHITKYVSSLRVAKERAQLRAMAVAMDSMARTYLRRGINPDRYMDLIGPDPFAPTGEGWASKFQTLFLAQPISRVLEEDLPEIAWEQIKHDVDAIDAEFRKRWKWLSGFITCDVMRGRAVVNHLPDCIPHQLVMIAYRLDFLDSMDAGVGFSTDIGDKVSGVSTAWFDGVCPLTGARKWLVR